MKQIILVGIVSFKNVCVPLSLLWCQFMLNLSAKRVIDTIEKTDLNIVVHLIKKWFLKKIIWVTFLCYLPFIHLLRFQTTITRFTNSKYYNIHTLSEGKTPLRYERGRNPDDEALRDVDEFVPG